MAHQFLHVNKLSVILLSLAVLLLSSQIAVAQTTAFAYQGKLNSNGNPANGDYDLQFKLYDTADVGTGTQHGGTLTFSTVVVSNGVFNVVLDFGACPTCFNGAARFLEVAVRPSGDPTFTTLAPRQPILSSPYAIRSLNAAAADGLSVACENCVTSSQILSVQGSQVTGNIAGSQINGAIPVASVPAGSSNYIQSTTAQQPSSNFNISGDGTAGGTLSGGIINAVTQYNLGGSRVLSVAGASNLFAGAGAGSANTGGGSNAFVGSLAGLSNTSGNDNAFLGRSAGLNTTTGGSNTFLGRDAGAGNIGGNFNTFVGRGADFSAVNSGGSNDTLLGYLSSVTTNLTNATAIGSRAAVTQSNSLVLGSISGVNGASADTRVGIGTTAPAERLHVVGNGLFTGNLTVNGNLIANIPAGSGNYIQNSTSQQAASNFNISGDGTAAGTLSGGIINAVTQYNLGGQRLLSTAGSNNLFAGINAGANNTGNFNAFFGDGAGQANTSATDNNFFGTQAGFSNTTGGRNTFIGSQAGFSNTTGGSNAFFGTFAGYSNTTGIFNTFTGSGAGQHNTTGDGNAFFGGGAGFSNTTACCNSFFGLNAGSSNTTGSSNAFFGSTAGLTNTTGIGNAFFGSGSGQANTTGNVNAFFGGGAGQRNTTGSDNAFFGSDAGLSNTTGGANAFFGTGAGLNNTTGSGNTLIGDGVDVSAGDLTNATAIGYQAQVAQSNSLVLGSISGVNNATADTKVGIGTTAPSFKLHIIDPSNTGLRVQTNTAGGTVASFGGVGDFQIDSNGADGGRLSVKENGNVGIGTNSPTDKLVINGGFVRINSLGVAGSTNLCLNGANQISSCSSSIRYKTNIGAWHSGLSLINRLRPVAFDWRQSHEHDLGLVAEEVAKVEPLLVTRNEKGEIEGVKYDRVSVVLLNAVKEQQALIERQQQQINALKQLVCSSHRKAKVCK